MSLVRWADPSEKRRADQYNESAGPQKLTGRTLGGPADQHK